MRYLFILIAVILCSCSGNKNSSKTGSDSWPIFRGDATLSGYTDAKLPDNPTLLWSYKSDSYTKSSPVVYRNTAYWSDKRGQIFGIDINGNRNFDYRFETAVEATPMIYDSILYIGRIDGNMSAMSLTKKDTLWNYETMGQISASPNRINFGGRQTIVFGSYDNYLYCVDNQTGKELNKFESGYYINGAVALWKDHVVFGGCDSYLRIVNCESGVMTDSLLLDAYVPASPAISGDICYIADYSGNIYEVKIKEGKFAESKKIVESKNDKATFVSVPAVSDNTLYILADDRKLYAINRKDGTTLWKFMLKGDTGESSPVVCDNRVIACSKSGIISIVDAQNGELVWEYDAGEQIIASPAVIKDHFYILTSKGTLFCFGNPKTE